MSEWHVNSYGTHTNGSFVIYRDSAEALGEMHLGERPFSLWDHDKYVGNFHTAQAARDFADDSV